MSPFSSRAGATLRHPSDNLPAGHWWRLIAGACALGLGLGLARFDFAILARQMLTAGWLESGGIARLGGLNTLGYLLGSLHHSRLRDSRSARAVLYAAVVAVVGSLALDSLRAPAGWDASWRILAGWGSGHLMAGIPPIALAHLSGQPRRRATGFVMSGAGLGAMIGSLVVGATAPQAPAVAGGVVAVIGAVLSLPVLWLLGSPCADPVPATREGAAVGVPPTKQRPVCRRAKFGLTAGYALLGAAQVPVVLYVPLIMSRRLDLSPALSSASLTVFGIGCVVGAFGATVCPKALPTRWLLPMASIAGLTGSVSLLLGTNVATLNLASFLSGAWIWLMVAFTYDRLLELVASTQARSEWAWMTSLLGMGFMLFSLLCSPLAVHQLPVVLAMASILAATHVVMELMQALPD